MSGLVLVVTLAVDLAHAWDSASTTAKGAVCTVAGVDGTARHTHGGEPAHLGTARFTVSCASATTLGVEHIEFLMGGDCAALPSRVASAPKVGGLMVEGMKASALTVTIPAGKPTALDVSFPAVDAYYVHCDRFAFRVSFRAGGELLVATAETNVEREEPLRE